MENDHFMCALTSKGIVITTLLGNDKHFPVCSNNAEAARLLTEAGANVNSRDCKGVTALAIASATGHCDVVKVLLDCRKVEINVQVWPHTLALLHFLVLYPAIWYMYSL